MRERLSEIHIRTTTAECRTLREQRDFVLRVSQADLATRAGMRQGSISVVENGWSPKPKHWARWANAYQITEVEFLRLLKGSIVEAQQKPLGGGTHGK